MEHIDYEYVIIVDKFFTSFYKTEGSTLNTDKVLFVYYVYCSNVLGIDKGCRLVYKSRQYVTNEKVDFNKDIISVMRERNINKIYLKHNAKVNVSMIKRVIPNLTVITI